MNSVFLTRGENVISFLPEGSVREYYIFDENITTVMKIPVKFRKNSLEHSVNEVKHYNFLFM